MAFSFKVLDQELQPYVTTWGEIEHVKDVLLAKTQLFVGSHSVTLGNQDGRFSPKVSGSLFKGRNYLNAKGVITDSSTGEVLFRGLISSITLDKSRRTATVDMNNFLSIPTSQNITRTDTGANPVGLILSILKNAGLTAYIDNNSFLAAAGPAAAAGATVNTAWTGNITVLSAIQALSELAAVSVFLQNDKIYCRPYVAYSGTNSQMRYEIKASNVINFNSLTDATSAFKTQVTVTYSTASTLTLTNAAALAQNNAVISGFQITGITGSPIVIPNLVSATYFGNLYLSRASLLRRELQIDGDNTLAPIRIGDRHPVTDTFLGFSNEPFEVIETHRKLDDNTTSLVLASLT